MAAFAGILDKATLTLGDNRRVDFSKTMLVMTSNLGEREIPNLSRAASLRPVEGREEPHDTEVDQKLYRTEVEAAAQEVQPRVHEPPRQGGRFRSLKEHHLMQILELELASVQDRIMKSAGTKFVSSARTRRRTPARRGDRFQVRRAPSEAGHRAVMV